MRVAFLSVLFSIALAAPAVAEHCTTWSTSTTNDDTLIVDLGPATIDFRYVVNDLCNIPRYDPESDGIDYDLYFTHGTIPGPVRGPTCVFSIWLYYESNGVEGLQRGDEVVDDSCHWMIEPDYFVW